jgi:hypothetical protein
MLRNGWSRLALAAALATLAACSASSTTTPTTPTSAVPTTDTFSGSVVQLGSATYVFAVTAGGEVQISLSSVAPLSTMSLGVAVMSSDGTNCLSTISQNTDARSGSIALQGQATAGKYCVKVYDSGNVPASTEVDYTVQVVHP